MHISNQYKGLYQAKDIRGYPGSSPSGEDMNVYPIPTGNKIFVDALMLEDSINAWEINRLQ